ncbi:MAG: DUF4861 domain-containing protein [Bacteroidales bacterium]|jgi:hypothetical protein|nr:DUF4861 domain-containing protein [Bacteroidales bacterium]
MRTKHILLSLFLTSVAMGAFAQKFKIPYSGTIAVEDYVYEIPKAVLPADFDVNTYAVKNGDMLFPIERSLDIDGNESFISIINITLDKRGRVSIPTVNLVKETAQYPKRTYAEITNKTGGKWVRNPKRRQLEYLGGEWVKSNYIRVPDEYTDHSFYIKYEGPGWESDKIGYRFYLDWRNANDIFAKTKPGLCLDKVGVDGYDSYHEYHDWGMDVLKVGDALGVGTFAYWTGSKAFRVEIFDSLISQVTADGKLRSQVKTDYYGWDYNNKGKKINATSLISIDAGSRASHMQLLLSEPVDNLCTGLLIDKKAEYFEKIDTASTWSYMASYGKQSLNTPQDNLGIAVIFRTKDLKERTTDKLNHVAVLTPNNQHLEYYFLGAWELEENGIKTKEAFIQYVEQLIQTLK